MTDMPYAPFARFRKKPVVVSAIQFTGDNLQSIDAFFGDSFDDWGFVVDAIGAGTVGVEILTLEGSMIAGVGDWIIRGVKGEFYPCKPDIFEATYEQVAASSA